MRFSYETWAQGKLEARALCRVERSMSCIPLRGDPICRACFESESEEATVEAQEREGGTR